MLISGGFIRFVVGLLYISAISLGTFFAYFFFSEPVMFCFVLYSVTLLILSYPTICLMVLTRTHDLDLSSPCKMEWVLVRSGEFNAESQIGVAAAEKPTKLDVAFTYAYM